MGSYLELNCHPDSNPQSRVSWEKNDTGHFEVGQRILVSNSETIRISAFQKEQKETYWCLANNSYGEERIGVQIIVESGTKWMTPLSLSVVCAVLVVGLTVFSCFFINKRYKAYRGPIIITASPETEGTNESQILESVYAVPQKQKKEHSTQIVPEQFSGGMDEDVPYADIVIRTPGHSISGQVSHCGSNQLKLRLRLKGVCYMWLRTMDCTTKSTTLLARQATALNMQRSMSPTRNREKRHE
nr:PREDICTED: uncharacterized protein LOC102365399 isoform X2 [Latimeria chalumnae]|eukprot:XP_005993752.1 PREDICTED: uncharacterized protein LOC102365399 isoform X2 [Latimeria chalumnae]